MRVLFLTVAIFTMSNSPTSAMNYNTLYAEDSQSNLYTVHASTGAATMVGSIGLVDVTDLAFRNSLLYGITFTQFLKIDPDTGSGIIIGDHGFTDLNALAVGPNGVIYSASNTTGDFLRIDSGTGQGTLVGNFGPGLTCSGDLAFGSNGALYVSLNREGYENDWLGSVNLNTGSVTLIGDLGYDEVHGLSVRNGTLYGATESGQLLKIDANTGAGTILGVSEVAYWGMATSPIRGQTSPYLLLLLD
jgi:hypothetical protein